VDTQHASSLLTAAQNFFWLSQGNFDGDEGKIEIGGGRAKSPIFAILV